MRYLLKTLALPPASSLLLAVLALILWRRYPKIARVLSITALVSLWLLATPAVSIALMQSLERQHRVFFPDQLATTQAEAIVILSGGMDSHASEFGYPVSDAHTLIRLRYGAFLHRETGLPVLTAGGHLYSDSDQSLAEVMANDLRTDFQLPTEWMEDRSHNTLENARFSAQILNDAGINHILLVTEGFHMPRSVRVFEQTGLTVTPAPTAKTWEDVTTLSGWLPTSRALHQSSLALHEYLGMLAYRWL